MNKVKALILLLLIFLLANCSAGTSNETADAISVKESTATAPETDSTAVADSPQSPSRKFIRTAELKFRVKDVFSTTHTIEDITKKHGGFVTFTELSGQVEKVDMKAVSQDSVMETTWYKPVNSIMLRVPNAKLDSTLREITRYSEFLDYRIIKAEDVALKLLKERMTQARSQKSNQRLDQSLKKHTKADILKAEEMSGGNDEKSDNAKISALSLTDLVNFSTVNINIYERTVVKREVVPDIQSNPILYSYLWNKFIVSIKNGWYCLLEVVIFLVSLWPLVLGLLIVYFAYRNRGFIISKRPAQEKTI